MVHVRVAVGADGLALGIVVQSSGGGIINVLLAVDGSYTQY